MLLIALCFLLYSSLVRAAFTDVNVVPTSFPCPVCSDAVADDNGNIYAIGANSAGTALALYIYPGDSTTGRTIEFPLASSTNPLPFYAGRSLTVSGGYIYITGFQQPGGVLHPGIYVFPTSATQLSQGVFYDLYSIWTANSLTNFDNIWGILVDANHVYITAPSSSSSTPTLLIFNTAANPLTAAPSYLTKVSLAATSFTNYIITVFNPYTPNSMRFANDGTNRIFIGTGQSNGALVLTINSFSGPMVNGVDYSGVFVSYPNELFNFVGSSVVNDLNGNFYFVKNAQYLYSMRSDGTALNRYVIPSASDVFSVFLKKTVDSGNFYNVYSVDRVTGVVYRMTSLVSALLTPPTGSGLGDPQFHGFAKQSFQVHGVAGHIYSIISDSLLQLNARFDYIDSGVCPPSSKGKNCWSHPGSYFGLLTIQTNNGDRLQIEAGAAEKGFLSITFNGRGLGASELGLNLTGRVGDDQMFVQLVDSYHMTVKAGVYTFELENSDKFINIGAVTVNDWSRLVNQIQSHGILGQTWRKLQGSKRGQQVAEIQGFVEDYADTNNDEWGLDTVFNKFSTATMA